LLSFPPFPFCCKKTPFVAGEGRVQGTYLTLTLRPSHDLLVLATLAVSLCCRNPPTPCKHARNARQAQPRDTDLPPLQHTSTWEVEATARCARPVWANGHHGGGKIPFLAWVKGGGCLAPPLTQACVASENGGRMSYASLPCPQNTAGVTKGGGDPWP